MTLKAPSHGILNYFGHSLRAGSRWSTESARRGREREIERRSRERRKFSQYLFTRLLPAGSLFSSPLARVTQGEPAGRLCWPRAKSPSNLRKPENISLLR